MGAQILALHLSLTFTSLSFIESVPSSHILLTYLVELQPVVVSVHVYAIFVALYVEPRKMSLL